MRIAGIMFIICGLMAAIPLYYIENYVDKQYLDDFLTFPWALGGALYIAGAITFMLKIPERFSSRTFDLFVIFTLLIHTKIIGIIT